MPRPVRSVGNKVRSLSAGRRAPAPSYLIGKRSKEKKLDGPQRPAIRMTSMCRSVSSRPRIRHPASESHPPDFRRLAALPPTLPTHTS